MPVDTSVPELEGFPGVGGHGPGPASSSAIRAEVDRMNNRPLTEQGKELGQWLRGLYDSGVRMYDKDMFRELEDAAAVQPRPDIVHLRSSTSFSLTLPHAMRTRSFAQWA